MEQKSINFIDLKKKVESLETELKSKYPAGYDYTKVYQVNPFEFFIKNECG